MKKLERNGGNALVETILYLPSALLLLFGVSDIGLRWLEQAAFHSAVRAGMREAAGRHEAGWRSRRDLQPRELVNFTADTIVTSIASLKSGAIGKEQEQFSVRLELLRLEVNTQTRQPEIGAVQVLAAAGPSGLSRSTELLRRLGTEEPSRLLLPKPFLGSEAGYAQVLLALYVRAHGQTRGLNSALIQDILGTALAADVEELVVLAEDDRD